MKTFRLLYRGVCLTRYFFVSLLLFLFLFWYTTTMDETMGESRLTRGSFFGFSSCFDTLFLVVGHYRFTRLLL
jgi:hypothetical protein